MNAFIEVSKLEAAERQLDQAVRLFFAREDEVSIHTLAAAAYQIIADICKHRGIQREIEDSTALEEFGIKKEVIAAIRKPQNFFKHAEHDQTGTVRLNPMLSVCLIMSAVQYLLKLKAVQSSECQIFRYWFFLKLPHKVPDEIRTLLASNRNPIGPEDYGFFQDAIMVHRTLKS